MSMIRDAARVEGEILERYRERTVASKARHHEAQQVMPAGDTRAATFFEPYPTYMAAGAGAWLRDCDGNRYLDLLNNFTSLAHGHAQPEIVEYAADQLTRGTVFGTAAEPQVALAKHLIERVPSIGMLRFTNSGTEATMMMMRAARAYTGRDIIVKIDGGYHGSHDFVEVSVSADTQASGGPTARLEGRGVPEAVLNAVMVSPFNDLAAMEDTLRQHHKRIAGIIIEPMPNSGGMVPPAPGYLAGLRGLADRYGVLLLFDEIVTLRLSSGGFQAIAGVRPDMTAIAKIIGGGFPVGAFGGRKEIMQLFNPLVESESLFHSGTFNGNNMTMTAGLAAMRRLDEAAIERINGLGERLQDGINGIFESQGIRAQCLGYGSLQQIQWTDQPVVTLADARRAGDDTGRLRELLHLELLNRGVYTSNRGMFCISTPMRDEEINLALTALEGALELLQPYMREAAPRLLQDRI
ncbi:MAG: aspartate aminotransferase family protein [Chloroflexi bacterium]|nr:aspartate aminotransferase family protein [Chloroflexota bacterium]